METTKTYFFGWTNIKKFVMEILKIYSNKPSFFSKKRIESSLAFIIGQYGMLMFLTNHLATMTAAEIIFWSSAEFAIAGWTVNQIQKEKGMQINATDNDATDPIDEVEKEIKDVIKK
jgi:hypothetical protein